jgi:hypothetical protein
MMVVYLTKRKPLAKNDFPILFNKKIICNMMNKIFDFMDYFFSVIIFISGEEDDDIIPIDHIL